MRIESPEDWWTAVEERWDHLVAMIDRYHPTSREPTLDQEFKDHMPITAKNAERACDVARHQIYKEEKDLQTPGVRAFKAKEAKDHEALGKILSGTWFGIPESVGCWDLPSFGVLSNLCSENWVFEEEPA